MKKFPDDGWSIKLYISTAGGDVQNRNNTGSSNNSLFGSTITQRQNLLETQSPTCIHLHHDQNENETARFRCWTQDSQTSAS